MDFRSRLNLAYKALQAALRTSGVPQRLDYFFPEAIVNPADTRAQRTMSQAEFDNKEWQRKFLVQLGVKGLFTVKGDFYSVKNRYQIENLVRGAQQKMKSPEEFKGFLDIVWTAGGGEPGGWVNALQQESGEAPSPAPETPQSYPEPTAVVVREETRPMEETREQAPAERSTDPVKLLQNIENMVTAVLTIQEKLAENIIYVRDRGDALHGKFKSLNERIAALEAKLDIPAPREEIDPELGHKMEQVVVSVNSISEAVHSMKAEVQQVVETSMSEKASDRIAQIQSSLTRISSEFGALRELTLDAFAEVPR
jgi:hypothetical protein